MNIDLAENEIILWTGNPNIEIKFGKLDFYIIPMTIVFTPGILIAIWAVFLNPNFEFSWNKIFAGTIVLAIIAQYLYLTIGRKYIDSYFKSKTYYILTNQRVLILYGDVKDLKLNKFLKYFTPNLTINKNKSYSIDLGETIPEVEILSYQYGWPSKKVVLSRFENIDNANDVYQLIVDAKASL